MDARSLTFAIVVAMILWRSFKEDHTFPEPKLFLYACLIWGVLFVMAEAGAGSLATALAIGFTIAYAFQYYNAIRPGNTTTQGNRDPSPSTGNSTGHA